VRAVPYLALLFALVGLGCTKTEAVLPDVSLHFRVEGQELRTLSLRELAAKAPPVVVSTDDPYYGKSKRFRAVSLESVLALGFAGVPGAGRELIFRAKDGYAVPFREAAIHEPGAFLAFADDDVPGYEPIGAQKVSPFPLYLVWTQAGQSDLEKHPRPWQLESIEMVRFESAFPHTAPPAQADPAASAQVQRGYDTFKALCFQCHAINRQGGRTGPELNVPQNVLEYLPESYVRGYIVKPATYRYGIMPAHETMTGSELDDLVGYLRCMKDRKLDAQHP